MVSITHNSQGYWVWRKTGEGIERLLSDGEWQRAVEGVSYEPTVTAAAGGNDG